MKNKRASKIISLIIAFALLFALLPFGAISSAIRLNAADAPHYDPNTYSFSAPAQSTPAFTSKTLAISNGDFSSSVNVFSSNYASGWTQTSNSNTNAVTGTLDTLNFDTFIAQQFTDNKDIPFMSVNPSSATTGNQNVLVIANKSTTTTAGISYSQSVGEFYADGFFEVLVDYYAVGGDKNPSAIYLAPGTDFNESARPIPSIAIHQATTTGMPENTSIWQTARFLVKTDALESVNFILSLHLGKRSSIGTNIAGSGVVYYDNVRASAYSESAFQPIWKTAQNDKAATNPSLEQSKNARNTCLVDLTKPYEKSTPVEKAALDPENTVSKYYENFDNSTTSFAVRGGQSDKAKVQQHTLLGNIAPNLNLKEVTDVYGDTKPDNSGAMLLSAVESTAGVRYKNPVNQNYSLKINRNTIYMISFYTLATDSTYFRLFDTRVGTILPDHIEPYDSGYLAIGRNQTSSSSSRNGWVLNTIFVTGEAIEDINVYFEFWVGGENDGTGYLLVDDFSVTYASQQYYARHNTKDNVSDLKLSKLDPTPDISNAYFNLGTNRSLATPYPLIASDWSISVEGETVKDYTSEIRIINGIVNTEEVIKDNQDIGHWNTNNVTLASGGPIGGLAYGAAINPREIKYTGNGINNNIYMMQNAEYTYQKISSTSFGLSTDSNNIISFDAATYALTNREVWAVIEVSGREVTRLRLCSETGDISGLKDWRNYTISIQTSKLTAPSCTINFILGDAKNKNMGCLFIDNISLQQNTSGNSDTSVNFNDPSKLYLKNSNETVDEGGESLFFNANDSSTASAYYNKINDVLAISTYGESYAVIENKMTENLASNKYYLYKVSVSLADVRILEEYYDTEEKPDWGITLKLKGMDGGFEYLRNEDIAKMPRYLRMINGKGVECIEFNFAINASESFNLALVIEFGSEDQPVTASLGIVGTSLTEIEKDIYNVYKEDSLARTITTATKDDSSDDDEGGNGFNFDWFLLPTIIMGLAILIAVVGTILRRTKFRKHITQSHTSYARDDTTPMKKAPTAKRAPKKTKTDTK